jgi:uncharacterized protein YndB with AHSA1/START domain
MMTAPRLPLRLLALSVAAALAAGSAAAQVSQHKGAASDGTRYYEDSLVINAPAQALWDAFTDTAAYRKWAAPVSEVDFRLGGAIEASYDPKGHLGDPQNIKNAYIAYIPGRLLVFQNVQAPDGLPGKAAYAKTVKTLEFEALGPNQTKVTVSGMGFGVGADFDKLYGFFSGGDASMLVTLKKAMESATAK